MSSSRNWPRMLFPGSGEATAQKSSLLPALLSIRQCGHPSTSDVVSLNGLPCLLKTRSGKNKGDNTAQFHMRFLCRPMWSSRSDLMFSTQSSQLAERQLQGESSVYLEDYREKWTSQLPLNSRVYSFIYTASKTFGLDIYCKSWANVSSCKS